MIELIAFDFSGTLVEYSIKQKSLDKIIEKYFNIKIRKDVFFYEKLKFFEFLYNDKLLEIMEENELTSIKNMKLLINRDTLEKLSERYKLAIISNNTRKMIEYALDRFGIAQYFDEIIAFEDAHPKPSPEPFLILSAKTNVKPQNILAIGDTNADALSSKSSGAFFISVSRKTILSDYTIMNVNEILDIDFNSLTELHVKPIKFYRSRKNTVFKTENNYIVKEHSKTNNAIYETMIHGRLYLKKIKVPRPIRLVKKWIVMDYVDGKPLIDVIDYTNAYILKSVANLLVKSFIETGLVNKDPTLRNFLVTNNEIYMIDFEDFAPGPLEESLGITVANIFSVKNISKEEAKRLSLILIKSFKETIGIENTYIKYATEILERKIKKLGRSDLINALMMLHNVKKSLID